MGIFYIFSCIFMLLNKVFHQLSMTNFAKMTILLNEEEHIVGQKIRI